MTYRARCTGRRTRPGGRSAAWIRSLTDHDSHLRWSRAAMGRVVPETRRQRRRRLYEEGVLERLGRLTLKEAFALGYTFHIVPRPEAMEELVRISEELGLYTELDK